MSSSTDGEDKACESTHSMPVFRSKSTKKASTLSQKSLRKRTLTRLQEEEEETGETGETRGKEDREEEEAEEEEKIARAYEETQARPSTLSFRKPTPRSMLSFSSSSSSSSSHRERHASAPFTSTTAVVSPPVFVADKSRLRSSHSDVEEDPEQIAVDTEYDRDSQAQYERGRKVAEEKQMGEYRGLNAVKSFIRHSEYDAGPGGVSKGPVRASSTIKFTSRFDYAPDICKDYYETGFCGYGDNCKFAHVRETYKTGWQLEREWEEEQKQKQMKLMLGKMASESGADSNENDEKSEIDDLPFACFICRGDFVNPVITKCGHFFCEKCALERYKKSKKCAVCGEATLGIFNTAHDIIRSAPKLRAKRRKMLQRAVEFMARQEEDGPDMDPSLLAERLGVPVPLSSTGQELGNKATSSDADTREPRTRRISEVSSSRGHNKSTSDEDDDGKQFQRLLDIEREEKGDHQRVSTGWKIPQ